MAAIVSSRIAADHAQRDGRRWVTERHLDNAGAERLVTYLAEAGADTAAPMTARAAQIAVDIAADEIARNVDEIASRGSLAVLSFIYSTEAENIAAVREAYRTAVDRHALMIADYLSKLSDPQLRSAFGLTQAQAAQLRVNRLGPAGSLVAQIRSAAGQ